MIFAVFRIVVIYQIWPAGENGGFFGLVEEFFKRASIEFPIIVLSGLLESFSIVQPKWFLGTSRGRIL